MSWTSSRVWLMICHFVLFFQFFPLSSEKLKWDTHRFDNFAVLFELFLCIWLSAVTFKSTGKKQTYPARFKIFKHVLLTAPKRYVGKYICMWRTNIQNNILLDNISKRTRAFAYTRLSWYNFILDSNKQTAKTKKFSQTLFGCVTYSVQY